jgi:hypothetical protein
LGGPDVPHSSATKQNLFFICQGGGLGRSLQRGHLIDKKLSCGSFFDIGSGKTEKNV